MANEMELGEAPNREKWDRKIEFLFACIGFCVGYGNLWRFPYMCFKNGGGAFLLPYLLFLLLGGIPAFMLELSVGQLAQAEPVHAWNRISPLLSGIGYASIAISFLVSIYYNVIMAWSMLFFYNAFKADIPWVGCDHSWNTDQCYVHNASNPNATGVSPAREFLVQEVLKVSEGLDDPGPVDTSLAVCLFVAWILIYFCIWKGVRTTGKIVYVTATAPYVVLVILFFRGVTLSGAGDGIVYYLVPDFKRLGDPRVWIDAASQILYSLAMGLGVTLTFASYNPRRNNVIRDALIVSLANCLTSVFAGFVIFSILGFIAGQQGKSVADVASDGPGLVFIAYPAALAQLPVPQLWSVLFFFMLIMLGIDSQFGQVEIVAACLIEHFRGSLGRHRELVVLGVCVLLFLPGLACVTHGGIYVFNLFDSFSAGLSLLLIVFCELVTVSWLYGAERFARDIEAITGKRVFRWWIICWKFITPLMVAVIFLFSLAKHSRIKYEDYVYPAWGEAVGWLIALASMLLIPGVAIVKIVKVWRSQEVGGQSTLQEKSLESLALEEKRSLEHEKSAQLL